MEEIRSFDIMVTRSTPSLKAEETGTSISTNARLEYQMVANRPIDLHGRVHRRLFPFITSISQRFIFNSRPCARFRLLPEEKNPSFFFFFFFFSLRGRAYHRVCHYRLSMEVI